MERRLEGGDAVLVPLELPSYFAYVLPVDALGSAALRPAERPTVDVVLTASINGYDSADSFTFDNCAYWHAIGLSRPHGASFTMTFPEDATAPVSATLRWPRSHRRAAPLGLLDARAVVQRPGRRRLRLRLPPHGVHGSTGARSRPTRGRSSSSGPAHYVVEFRSVDGAANEEGSSRRFDVLPPPDATGTG